MQQTNAGRYTLAMIFIFDGRQHAYQGSVSVIQANCTEGPNPSLPNGNYSYRIIKITFSKKEWIKKKFSYERRVYESVDDRSLS